MATKKCTRCGQTKDLSEFNKNKSTPDELEYHCRTCKKEEGRIMREKRRMGAAGNGSRLKKKRIARSPSPSQAIEPDVQFLTLKKSLILDFVKTDLPRIIEERFAQ